MAWRWQGQRTPTERGIDAAILAGAGTLARNAVNSWWRGGKKPVRAYSRAGKRGRKYGRANMVNARTGGYLGKELKFYDTSYNMSNIPQVPATASPTGLEVDPNTVNCISAPAQGDGEENRDGNRIVIKSGFVEGNITLANTVGTTTPPESHFGFVAVVLDKQSNGAQLNSEDVYHNQTAANDGADCLLRNLQYSSRFRVLAVHKFRFSDIDFVRVGATNFDIASSSKHFRLAFKGPIPVQFKGGATAAGVSGVADNSIHVLAGVNSLQCDVGLTYNARIRFQG